MRTKLIPIGNSRGIRIPKTLIEQCGLADQIELEPRDGELVLRSSKNPRAGWDAAFQKMAENGDDELLDAEEVSKPTEWERKQWKW